MVNLEEFEKNVRENERNIFRSKIYEILLTKTKIASTKNELVVLREIFEEIKKI